jgi:preprotein translocase subunit Sss1
MEKPTQEQLDELRRLSRLARVPDESEIVMSREEADVRIRDLQEKARME